VKYPVPSNNLQFALNLTLEAQRPSQLRVITYDKYKRNTKYSDRYVEVKGRRTIYLTFPQSPESMVLMVYNTDKSRPNDFRIVGQKTLRGKMIPYEVMKLRKCDVWMDSDAEKFFAFAELFSKNSGILTNGKYSDDSGKFVIDYKDFIIDKNTNQLVNTPARIGHTTGTIHVSKQYFVDYTVPMRMIILLHEFSHKYINPKFGKKITNEFAADINALYIYLGKGYPPIDARIAYLQVFNQDDVDPQLSLKRYKFIDDFMNKFQQNEFTKCNVNYKK
jgi:hypothetical protein